MGPRSRLAAPRRVQQAESRRGKAAPHLSAAHAARPRACGTGQRRGRGRVTRCGPRAGPVDSRVSRCGPAQSSSNTDARWARGAAARRIPRRLARRYVSGQGRTRRMRGRRPGAAARKWARPPARSARAAGTAAHARTRKTRARFLGSTVRQMRHAARGTRHAARGTRCAARGAAASQAAPHARFSAGELQPA